jgi:hypothetical protein
MEVAYVNSSRSRPRSLSSMLLTLIFMPFEGYHRSGNFAVNSGDASIPLKYGIRAMIWGGFLTLKA